MTRSLRSSLIALTIFGLLGLTIQILSHSKARASYGYGAQPSRLSLMADSMHNVTLGLDAELSTLVNSAIESTAGLLDADIVRSQEVQSLSIRLGQLRGQLRSLPTMDNDAFALNSRIAEQRRFADEFSALLNQRRVLAASLPTALPARGRFSSDFGYRVHPISRVRKKHDGMDIAARTGTPIYASGSGKVLFSGVKGGYGNVVEIDHGYGYVTRYAHASRRHVAVGEQVQRGDRIADIGSTGASTGPHLHFEVLVDDVAVDPAPFVNPHMQQIPEPTQVASATSSKGETI